jgi:hypothetical protein
MDMIHELLRVGHLMTDQGKFSKKIFKSNADRLAAYCDYYAIDRRELQRDPLLLKYITAHQQILDELINGYEEMGPLNKKICNEFVECECECELKIVENNANGKEGPYGSKGSQTW